MRRGLLVVAAAAALAASIATHSAQAKMPSYIITGGDLGSYATTFSTWKELAGEGAARIDPPVALPSREYDVYQSGSLALAQRLAHNGGPEMRYYPEIGVLQYAAQEQFPETWYRLSADDKATFDNAIVQGIEQMAKGELEVGPLSADLRSSLLPNYSYWLRPASVTNQPGYRVPMNCVQPTECIHLGPTPSDFIMRELKQTISGTLHIEPSLPPAYVIEGYAPQGAVGVLGFYAPPTDGEAGHFWFGSYGVNSPYLETTPGFDAFIRQGIDRAQEGATDATMPAPSPGRTMPLSVWVGVSAAMTAALAGAGAMYARRARRPA